MVFHRCVSVEHMEKTPIFTIAVVISCAVLMNWAYKERIR